MKAILLTVCLLLTAPITGDGPPPTSITTPASSALARGGRDAASGPAGATAIIKAPAQVSPGDLVILDASDSDAKAFAWTVLPESAAGKFLAVERGTKAVFASGQPGQYTFVLATAAGDHVAVALATVTVGVPGPVPPGPGPGPGPGPPENTKVTAAMYVYEKDQHAIPAPVAAALHQLNIDKKLLATIFEQDTTSGTGQTPTHYKVPLTAAREAGLPALVVMVGDKVLRVVKAPKTEADVLEAVK